MKAHELAKILLEGPDVRVVLQKDSEGNGYSPCAGADHEAVYLAENDYSGTVYTTTWSADDADMEEEEWDNLRNSVNDLCVVLFPIN